MRHYLRDVLSLLGEDRRRLPGLVGLFLGASLLDLLGLGLVVPYVSIVLRPDSVRNFQFGGLLDRLGSFANTDDLLSGLGLALVLAFLVKTVLGLWINRCIVRFSQDQQIRLRSQLMRAYQSLPYADYLRRNSADYIHGIQSLANQYATAVVSPLLRMLSDAIVATVIVVILARANITALSLMVLMFGSVVFLYDRYFRVHLRDYGVKANQGAKKLVKGVHEGVDGLKEIRVLGKERNFYDMVVSGATQYAENTVKVQQITAAPRYLLELVLIAFIVSLVTATLRFGGDVQALAPVLALFGVASLRLLPMVNVISNGILSMRHGRHIVSQLLEDMRYLELVSEQNAKNQPVTKATVTSGSVQQAGFHDLVVSNVCFSYENSGRDALKDICLQVSAGESIGLIGTSGAGKTTLVDVLLGLLEPQCGEILYNGEALSLVMSKWRGQVAYLPQQIFLIDDTLRRNVALGESDDLIDEDRLLCALRQARLIDLVEELPSGVNTVIGERGVRLSGGQRQRVALARAFYHGRSVLVMDEATSALDNDTEKDIVFEIQRLKGLKTMIVIAHRFSTVEHCDRIYKLEGGRIVATGTPDELLGIGGGASRGG